ncbi:Peptide-methionine (R)-S-oxide reductase [Mycena chlorophos]|uniref:Peptide-methionine (R)-S-oxide reductase n=1 Tax=Mycena chlorophos TaxID=658473 RepID=A0A8H6T1J5_MYCCL|nr:Peptide-methionine (R)-S-oxide reductase [Mycena chlorophos]
MTFVTARLRAYLARTPTRLALRQAPSLSAAQTLNRYTLRTMATKVEKTEDEWRAVLSREQFRVLREKGTERANTGAYDKLFDEGVYSCAGCGAPLYESKTKFNSGCGWPAYYEGLPNAINRHVDKSWGMERIEITCAACGGHLGHVFKGEKYDTPTDERHCVNSISLTFRDKDGVEKPQDAVDDGVWSRVKRMVGSVL